MGFCNSCISSNYLHSNIESEEDRHITEIIVQTRMNEQIYVRYRRENKISNKIYIIRRKEIIGYLKYIKKIQFSKYQISSKIQIFQVRWTQMLFNI